MSEHAITITDRQIEAARYLINWASAELLDRMMCIYAVTQYDLIALFETPKAAQVWQPLPDGSYQIASDVIIMDRERTNYDEFEVDGNILMFRYGIDEMGKTFPDAIRLCKKVA